MAVFKRAGLPTQAPAGIDSLESHIRESLPQGSYLAMIHRLDRAVSGVVLVAITPRAARKMSRQFERREIEKTYLAILEGDSLHFQNSPGSIVEWHDTISKVENKARAEVVPDSETDPLIRSRGKQAFTRARLLAKSDRRMLVELSPQTGRMHQLRLQSSRRGMPIVGDSLYESRETFGNLIDSDSDRDRAIALHAHWIAWNDPDTFTRCEARAAVPDFWRVIEPTLFHAIE